MCVDERLLRMDLEEMGRVYVDRERVLTNEVITCI
jgi:hypothetical protein